MVLAATWHPAFCETAEHRRECKDLKTQHRNANAFVLHGLWFGITNCEGPRYQRLPDALWQDLRLKMPGTASRLHIHEWEKHGRCYTHDSAIYYRDALKQLEALNETDLRAFFQENRGVFLKTSTIRSVFDREFGRGMGMRINVKCVRDGDRLLITELRIALKGSSADGKFEDLLKSATPQRPGCRGGYVDQPGFQ